MAINQFPEFPTSVVHRANASTENVSSCALVPGYYMVSLYPQSGPSGTTITGAVVFGTPSGNISVSTVDDDTGSTVNPSRQFVNLPRGATSITTNFGAGVNGIVVVSFVGQTLVTTGTSVTTYTTSQNVSIPSNTVSWGAYIIGGGGRGANQGRHSGGGGGGYMTQVTGLSIGSTHFLTVGGGSGGTGPGGTTTWGGFSAAGGNSSTGTAGATGGSNGGSAQFSTGQGGGDQPFYESWVPRGGGGSGAYCGADGNGPGGGGGGFGNGGNASCGTASPAGTGAGGGGGNSGVNGGTGGLALRLIGSAW
jgi:hypothetical protein